MHLLKKLAIGCIFSSGIASAEAASFCPVYTPDLPIEGKKSIVQSKGASAEGGTIRFEDGIYIQNDLAKFYGKSASLNLKEGAIRIEDVEGYVFDKQAFLIAEEATFNKEEEAFTLKDAVYSSCSLDQTIWHFTSDTVKLDKGNMQAIDSWAHFIGVPIFYVPWFSLDVRRPQESGFLPPDFDYTSINGESIFTGKVPLYLLLAPNFDVLSNYETNVTKYHWFSHEARYLNSYGNAKANLYYNQEFEWYVKGSANAKFGGWKAKIKGERAEDKFFDSILSERINKSSYLESSASLNYTKNRFRSGVYVEDYQLLTGSGDFYRKLFEGNANYYLPNLLSVSANNEYFSSPGGTRDTIVRFRSDIKLQRSFASKVGTFTPSLNLFARYYARQKRGFVIPSLQMDYSFFYRLLAKQRLEARVRYGYVPRIDQSKVINVDSGTRDFSESSLLETRRFYGNDRFGDAHYITLLVGQDYAVDRSWANTIYARVVKRFWLNTPSITLDDNAIQTTEDLANIALVTGVDGDAYRLQSIVHFDHDKINRFVVGVESTADSAWQWKVKAARGWNKTWLSLTNGIRHENFSITANGIYDIGEKRIDSYTFGVRYDLCCMAFTLGVEEKYIGEEAGDDAYKTSYRISVRIKL